MARLAIRTFARASKSWLLRAYLSGTIPHPRNAAGQPVPMSSIAGDSEIRAILADRIDAYRQSLGMVVGVVEPNGRRVVAYGKLDHGDPRQLDGDTLFEIGSVTKIFTALLLADMVRRREVALDDPVEKYIDIKVPERDGRTITLVDLATHTSGLPSMPANLAPKNLFDPFADYSTKALSEFLSTHVLKREIGSQFEYSNLGMGLLGLALARASGNDYESLVRSRVIEPLHMAGTGITLSPASQARLAAGHDADLARSPNWRFSETFVGAGALRSSANDLLTFLAANLGYTQTPLAHAMADMIRIRRSIGAAGQAAALAWGIATTPETEFVAHSGQTGGYHSFIAYDTKARIGIVVLANASTDIDDIGWHLIAGAPLRRLRKEITVDPNLLEGYLGCYEVAPDFLLTVTRQDDGLFVQATGQSRIRIVPENERDYFARAVDAQITFQTDPRGRATRLTLHQNGKDLPGKRVK
jgi:serine-type D-Ala-D-Ala carboxypeptidase/endopeptidase